LTEETPVIENRITTFLIVAIALCNAPTARADAPIAIVPKPLRIERAAGAFAFNADTAILIDGDSLDAANVAKQLSEQLRRSTGLRLPVSSYDGKNAPRNAVVLTAKKTTDALEPEGYTLDATPERVPIAGDGPGLVEFPRSSRHASEAIDGARSELSEAASGGRRERRMPRARSSAAEASNRHWRFNQA
jgi:hypothetical protein